MPKTPDDTIPVEVPSEQDTEPTAVVTRNKPPAAKSEIAPPPPKVRARSEAVFSADESIEMATDVDLAQPITPSDAPTPITPAMTAKEIAAALSSATPASSPVVALAKPKGKIARKSFADRKLRLPTESEIRAAVEGTPTEQLPAIDINVDDTDDEEEEAAAKR